MPGNGRGETAGVFKTDKYNISRKILLLTKIAALPFKNNYLLAGSAGVKTTFPTYQLPAHLDFVISRKLFSV